MQLVVGVAVGVGLSQPVRVFSVVLVGPVELEFALSLVCPDET